MRADVAVSVIVPSIGRCESVRDLLRSLAEQECRVPFEVIVVANLPDRNLQKIVEAHGPRYRYLETGRIGANIARNRGISCARGSILLFLDDDCFAHDKMLIQKHWDLHEKHPDAVGCGGRYALRDGASRLEQAYHWIADHWLTKSLLDQNRSLNLIGGNASFKVNLLGSDRHFEESIVFGGAETELCARLVQRGCRLLLFDGLEVEHRLTMDVWTFMRKAYLQGFSAGVRQASRLNSSLRHWHSTLTVEENIRRAGHRPDPRFRRFYSLYERLFDFGFRVGRRAKGRGVSAPPLSLVSFLRKGLLRSSFARVRNFLYRSFLTLDRSLAISHQRRKLSRK